MLVSQVDPEVRRGKWFPKQCFFFNVFHVFQSWGGEVGGEWQNRRLGGGSERSELEGGRERWKSEASWEGGILAPQAPKILRFEASTALFLHRNRIKDTEKCSKISRLRRGFLFFTHL